MVAHSGWVHFTILVAILSFATFQGYFSKEWYCAENYIAVLQKCNSKDPFDISDFNVAMIHWAIVSCMQRVERNESLTKFFIVSYKPDKCI